MEATTQKESKGILLSFDQGLFDKYLKTFNSIKGSLLNEYDPLLKACGLTLNRESLNWLTTSTSERPKKALSAVKNEVKLKADKALADLYLKSIKSNIDDLQGYLSRFEPYSFFKVGMMSDETQFYSKWISFDENGQLHLSDTSIEEIKDNCSIYIPANHYFHIVSTLDEYQKWYNEKFIHLMKNYGTEVHPELINQLFNTDAESGRITMDPKGVQWLLQMKKHNNPTFEPETEILSKEKLKALKNQVIEKLNFLSAKRDFSIEQKNTAEARFTSYKTQFPNVIKQLTIKEESLAANGLDIPLWISDVKNSCNKVIDSFEKTIASFNHVICSYDSSIESIKKILEGYDELHKKIQ